MRLDSDFQLGFKMHTMLPSTKTAFHMWLKGKICAFLAGAPRGIFELLRCGCYSHLPAPLRLRVGILQRWPQRWACWRKHGVGGWKSCFPRTVTTCGKCCLKFAPACLVWEELPWLQGFIACLLCSEWSCGLPCPRAPQNQKLPNIVPCRSLNDGESQPGGRRQRPQTDMEHQSGLWCN